MGKQSEKTQQQNKGNGTFKRLHFFVTPLDFGLVYHPGRRERNFFVCSLTPVFLSSTRPFSGDKETERL
jgi:hypothetical protein